MEIETQSYITNLLKTNPKIVENNLNYIQSYTIVPFDKIHQLYQ